MVKKPIFLHIRKKVCFFLVLNTFFIIPNITFAESKIYWNAQTDVFSIQSMSSIREVLDCIEANSDYMRVCRNTRCTFIFVHYYTNRFIFFMLR